MLTGTFKTALFMMAAATISMTALALPAARAITAGVPISHLRLSSCAQIRELISGSHNALGNIAADVVCSYLRKFEPGTVTVAARQKQEHYKANQAGQSVRAYGLAEGQ